MEAFAQSIEGGVIYTWVTSVYWLWPLMETIHFIGLSLLLGGLIVIDGRLAGFFPRRKYCRDAQAAALGYSSDSV